MASTTPRASARKSPRDVTGRKAAEMAEDYADELKKRASEMSTVAGRDLDFDLDLPDVPSTPVEMPSAMADLPTRRLRVNVDLEDVTIGHGTNFNFYRGQVYTVPSFVYDHLEEKGCVWH